MVDAKFNLIFRITFIVAYLFSKCIYKFPANELQAPDLIFRYRLGPQSAEKQKPLCILSAWHNLEGIRNTYWITELMDI